MTTPQAPGPKSWPLTPMNLGFHYLGAVTNTNACALFVFDSRLDLGRLEAAIHAALARHPLLNCRLRKRGRRYFWQASSDELPIQLRVHELDSDEAELVHQHLLDRVWSEPLALEVSRPIRFHLTQTPLRTYLQIVSPHTITDAQAIVRIARDLAECYSALEAGRQPDQTPLEVQDRAADQIVLGRISRWARLWHFFHALWLILLDVLRPDVGLDLAQERGGTDLRFIEFEPGFIDHLVGAAKRQRTSVHAVFSLAILRAYQQSGPSRPERWLRALDQVSLRGYLGPEAAEVFDVLSIPYSLRMNPRWSDAEVVTNITTTLRTLRDGAIFSEILRMRIYTTLAKLLPTSFLVDVVTGLVMKTNLLTTNPGALRSEVHAFGSVPVCSFCTFPPLLPPSRVSILFFTYQRQLRTLLLYDRAALRDPEQLLERLAGQLRRIAGVTQGASPVAALIPPPFSAPNAARTANASAASAS
jgi:hypothetical protein